MPFETVCLDISPAKQGFPIGLDCGMVSGVSRFFSTSATADKLRNAEGSQGRERDDD